MERKDADFLIVKRRPGVERYVRLIEELRPKRIFELGIFQGGSTALLAELARPQRLVAIDKRAVPGRVEEYAARRGPPRRPPDVRGLNQADRGRLAAIVEESFSGEELDLVIDDCSHLYEETRASFNELFPRLRPGGVFVIEDWPWAHTPGELAGLEEFYTDQLPLTRLILELVLALPRAPGLIAGLEIDYGAVTVRRGEAKVDPGRFEISAYPDTRGRQLLAP